MILHLRYHVFTLMAIFLALGVGLLIGSTMVVRDTLLEEQQRLILRMEKDFHGLRRENKELLRRGEELKEELVLEKDKLEVLLTLFLQDTLKDLKVFMHQEVLDVNETDLPPILSLTGALLVDRQEDAELFLKIGDGSEEGVIYLQEGDLHLPHLLEVILEVIRSEGGVDGSYTSLQ